MSDAQASIDIITPGSFPTTTVRAGLECRRVDGNNTFIARLYKDSGTSEIELVRVVGGSSSVVKKTDMAAAGVAASSTYTLAVQCLGDEIRVLLNGKARLTYQTQSGDPVGTRFGLYREGSPSADDGCVFDNMAVSAVATS